MATGKVYMRGRKPYLDIFTGGRDEAGRAERIKRRANEYDRIDIEAEQETMLHP